MRVAFVGKGGSGKSVIAGTLARLLAADGRRVLAVDSDPLPGMAYALGIALADSGIPDEAVTDLGEGARPRYRLREGLSAEAAVQRYAVRGRDGLRFLQIGKVQAGSGRFLRSSIAFRQILDELGHDRWDVVGDLPGGTRQPFFGWARYADALVIVVEPTAKSLLAARRLARLGSGADAPRMLVVANKVQGDEDVALLSGRCCGIPLAGHVPADAALEDAERTGAALLDHAPASAAVSAIRSLARTLLADEFVEKEAAP